MAVDMVQVVVAASQAYPTAVDSDDFHCNATETSAAPVDDASGAVVAVAVVVAVAFHTDSFRHLDCTFASIHANHSLYHRDSVLICPPHGYADTAKDKIKNNNFELIQP